MRMKKAVPTVIAGLVSLVCFAPPLVTSAVADRGDCNSREVCFWTGSTHVGKPQWRWEPGNGRMELPGSLKYKVGAFQANTKACFYGGGETRVVNGGDFRVKYTNDFGSRIDSVGPC
ncbi:hypothetical protein ACFH04_08245 [Streptomyces noboritoensis]|uniref:Peptidase inhibitor family I36 n=1 Tax=Streptomyces noboritoensis TaxID=67337 RepID=A0ABV6TEX4_9ACTN